MKSALLTLLSLFISISAYASNLFCDGINGYEISNSPGKHAPWTKITVQKNGTVVVAGLNENDSGFIQRDEDTAEYVQVIRAATVKSGIVSSLVLSIRLNNDGGRTGVGNAVIYDGSSATIVNGLNCKTP